MHDPDHQTDRDELDRWIATGDLDELIREIDRCAERGGDDGWARVLLIRDRSRAATERGHQLWPAASYAEYRTALDAPAEIGPPSVVVDGAGFLAPGPLTEVVAQVTPGTEIVRRPRRPARPARSCSRSGCCGARTSPPSTTDGTASGENCPPA